MRLPLIPNVFQKLVLSCAENQFLKYVRYIFLLVFVSAFADFCDPFVLATTEGDPTSNLCPYVNSLTGDFSLSEEDLVVLAAEPLVIRRTFVPNHMQSRWEFFAHTKLEIVDGSRLRKKYIHLAEPTGGKFTYKRSFDDRKTYRFDLQKHGKGVSNTTSGTISGRTNHKNSFLRVVDENTITMLCCNGIKRHYKKRNSHLFVLEKEILPNGNIIRYKYDNKERICTVQTESPTGSVYAKIRFLYENKHHFKIITSDGRTLSYQGSPGHIKKVISPEKPEEIFKYKIDLKSGVQLYKRSFPEGRVLKADYYTDQNSPSLGRVKTFWETVGDQVIPTYTFSYDIARIKTKEHRYAYYKNGKTDIYDVEGNKTSVLFSKDFYTQEIQSFINKGSHQEFSHSLHFNWSQGELESKFLVDAHHKTLWKREFKYDSRGNVLLETFSGDLSGKGKTESYRIAYTYNDDNLMLSQTEDNGRITLYTYFPGTDLLESRFIADKEKILKREFRFYDNNHLLKIVITDDGSSHDCNNLADVSERFITRFNYNSRGLPEEIQEIYLNGIEEKLVKNTAITYNAFGQVIEKKIFDANGEYRYSLTYSYDTRGRLKEETNAIGQVAKTTYDEYGNLLFYSPYGDYLHQHLRYDKSHCLKQIEEIDLEGKHRFTYHTYNLKKQRVTTCDFMNNTTTFSYDLLGNIIKTLLPPVFNEEGEKNVPVVENRYDCAGRQTSHTSPSGHTTITHYNSRGSPILILFPDGTKKQFFYNLDGTLRKERDQAGTLISYKYDILKRITEKNFSSSDRKLLASESTIYTAFHPQKLIDLEGRTTDYTYDCAGRQSSETHEGETISYTFDALGRVHSVQHEDFCLITEYDLLDRILEEREEDLSGTLLAKTTYDYDRMGNRSRITRFKDCNTTHTEFLLYDSWGRLREKRDPMGHVTRYNYNENARNSFGQFILETIETSPLGQQTFTRTDALGRITSVEKKNAFAEELSLEQFFYDLDNHLSRQVSTLLSPSGQKETLVTRWNYNQMGQMIRIVQAEGMNEQKTTTYTYNPTGEPETITKPDGTILTYTYDALGRLEELSSSIQDLHYRYHYSKQSLPELVEDLIANTSTTLTYDNRGRITSETLANGLTLKYHYEASRGRRSSMTLPDQSTVHYRYDVKNLRAVSRFTPYGTLLYEHQYTDFDMLGNLTNSELIANLGNLHFQQDALSRCTQIQSAYHTETIEEFDPCGNIKRLKRNGKELAFHYDSLNQLTSEPGHTYLFDSHHRRLEKDNQAETLNLLAELISAYQYDRNGNPILKHSDNTEYHYDSLDRLIEVIQPDKLRLVFAYDPFNRRLTKTHYLWQNNNWQPSDPLNFLYDDQNEIGAVTQDGTLKELRILGLGHGAEIGAAIAIELDQNIYAPIHDLYGNLATLICPLNGTIETYTYTSFGEETSSSHLSPWRYASKRTDDETQLVYFGRRYYDPTHARWLTPDPAGFLDHLNLYTYLHNSPLTHHDLHGLFSKENSPQGFNFNEMLTLTSYAAGFAFNLAKNILGFALDFLGTHFIPDLIGGEYLRAFGRFLTNDHSNTAKEYSAFTQAGSTQHYENITVTAVNGIVTIRDTAEHYAQLVSSYFGDQIVHFLHNSSEGIPADLSQALIAKAGFPTDNAELLAAKWRTIIAEGGGINSSTLIFHIAFSEGGAITEQALRLLTPAERKKIAVTTFGSASLFSSSLAGFVKHFVSVRDPVPLTSPINYLKAVFCNLFGLKSNVEFVGSWFGIPLTDHGFTNKCYSAPMEEIGRHFQRNELGSIFR